MNRNKTLRELGSEYEAAAEIVKKRIAVKRAKLRGLADSVCSNEAYEIKSELEIVYREYREAKEIAEHLRSYYEPDVKSENFFSY